ncbi:type VI secretion system Vgr family protein, partial [Pseudothauera lacus]|uniref:type VI secretion system Vgr family protein n=1 Tax=Pseudothauera lacus TaxID=2136175 RepID=UPI001F184FB7
LTEEGLGWCLEEDPEAPAGHRLLLFADSATLAEDDTSASALGGPGIRYHRADSQEEQDAVLALSCEQRAHPTRLSALSHDYRRKAAIAAQVPTDSPPGGPALPELDSYDSPGLYAWASAAEAQRYLTHTMQAHEVRRTTYRARSTVRSLRAGRRLRITDAPAPAPAAGLPLTVARITHLGINNLTAAHLDTLAERLAQPAYCTAFEQFQPPGDDDAFDDDPCADLDDPFLDPYCAKPRAGPHDPSNPDTPLRRPAPRLPHTTAAHSTPAAQPARAIAPPAALIALALARGYANHFTAHPTERPWRPRQHDDNGTRLNPRPTAPGPMNAIVVGPHGEQHPDGSDELWCDALGRIRVRFLWQQGEHPDDRLSCWMRVLSRQAGPRMGWQWLPRIGQEVLVDFIDGDIDRPYVHGVLYNGQGEGGTPPTPGGAHLRAQASTLFEQATDLRPAAQGNHAGGHAPAWHGGAAAGHRHPGALSGFKSKEFGGTGYNQLVFDDSNAQLRIQLHSTQAASALNLGHLIHQADNYRGSFRGAGIELRTDHWGSSRAAQGMVLSTWPAPAPGADAAQPAGDFAPGIALIEQSRTLTDTLARAARHHRSVDLAAARGSTAAAGSRLNDAAAPLEAQHIAARGMVDATAAAAARSDAGARTTTVGAPRVPHLADPLIATAARAGLGLVAGQALQLANGDTLSWTSGAHTNLAIGGRARIHAGQAIGLVAGAIAPGEGNTGLALIAAHDDIDLAAHSSTFALQARDTLDLASLAEHIDFAAAKRIVIAVDGGASITLDGSITVRCPGTLTIHAAKKSFSGPTRMGYALPQFPRHLCEECLLSRAESGSALVRTT